MSPPAPKNISVAEIPFHDEIFIVKNSKILTIPFKLHGRWRDQNPDQILERIRQYARTGQVTEIYFSIKFMTNRLDAKDDNAITNRFLGIVQVINEEVPIGDEKRPSPFENIRVDFEMPCGYSVDQMNCCAPFGELYAGLQLRYRMREGYVYCFEKGKGWAGDALKGALKEHGKNNGFYFRER